MLLSWMTARKNELIKNFDHLETLKFSHATVKGFTEQGLYMLATILKQVLPHTPWARSFWAFSPFLNRMLKFSQLIVENSATSTASFKYFILQHQPLHSATSSALFSQRNCLFHPAKSNPSPNEVVSLTQRSRILNPAQSYPSIQWNVWTCAMTYMKRKRLTWWLPGCFWNYVPTYLLLRRDASFTASGRSKCCIRT